MFVRKKKYTDALEEIDALETRAAGAELMIREQSRVSRRLVLLRQTEKARRIRAERTLERLLSDVAGGRVTLATTGHVEDR